jgi:hypothetical protein
VIVDSALHGCDIASLHNWFPTVLRNVFPSCSKVLNSEVLWIQDPWGWRHEIPSKGGTDLPVMQRLILEERNPRVLRNAIMKEWKTINVRACGVLFPNTRLYRHLQIHRPVKSLTHVRPDRSHHIINSSDTYPVIDAKRKSVFEPATAWSCLFHCKLIRSSVFWEQYRAVSSEQYRAVSSLHITFGCWTLTFHVMISIYDFWRTRRKYSLSIWCVLDRASLW